MVALDLSGLPLAVNLALFGAGAVVVWLAGSRLALYADALAERTGLGRAFLGLVLLAGVTELPEVVTSLSAVALDNAPLALNNLFGGIVMQTAILAVGDALLGRGSLTYFTPRPELLLQGVLLITLLGLVLAGTVAGDVGLFAHVGAWTTAVFALYVMAVWLVARYETAESWRPVDLPDVMHQRPDAPIARSTVDWSLRRVWIALGVVAVAILLAGTVLSATSDAIAAQTTLGSSFVGATLLATTTSLPELSTTLGAIRLRAYGMAFANIFGSNAIMVALLFVTDVAHVEGPILLEVDPSAQFAAAMGIVVTTLYLVGLILRRHDVVLRMGLDSFLVLCTYVGTVAGLYFLRS